MYVNLDGDCHRKIKPALEAQLFRDPRPKDPWLPLILKRSQPLILNHPPPFSPYFFGNNIHTSHPLGLACMSISLSFSFSLFSSAVFLMIFSDLSSGPLIRFCLVSCWAPLSALQAPRCVLRLQTFRRSVGLLVGLERLNFIVGAAPRLEREPSESASSSGGGGSTRRDVWQRTGEGGFLRDKRKCGDRETQMEMGVSLTTPLPRDMSGPCRVFLGLRGKLGTCGSWYWFPLYMGQKAKLL